MPVAARAIAFPRLMADLAPSMTSMAPVGVVVSSGPHAVLWVRNVLTTGNGYCGHQLHKFRAEIASVRATVYSLCHFKFSVTR